MRSRSKIFLLIATLAFPGLVYLFLRTFGVNHYNIPLLYSDGIPLEGCENKSIPHKVLFPDSLRNQDKTGTIIYFPAYFSLDAKRQLARIRSEFPMINLMGIATVDSLQNSNDEYLVLTESELSDMINCQLVLGENKPLREVPRNKIVLIDKNLIIRGYYDAQDLEDMDRLSIELEILIKNSLNKNE